ncbi:MAG: tetratricopeptide repeat protein [Candidatus Electrothrix scaldis]|nr:MAG: tetratricopeptide repeat protein [Candidatus Electrothrix sp. GW3-3]
MSFYELYKNYTRLQEKEDTFSSELQKLQRYMRSCEEAQKKYDLQMRVLEIENELKNIFEQKCVCLDEIEKLPKKYLNVYRASDSHKLTRELQDSILDNLYEIFGLNRNADGFENIISIQAVSPHLTLSIPEDLAKKLEELFCSEEDSIQRFSKKFNISRVEQKDSKNKALLVEVTGDNCTVPLQEQLSVKSSIFVGRQKELDQFKDHFLFTPENFVLNIHTNGDGGVGKTQLLLQMQKKCRIELSDKVVVGNELIDFYHTESRSKIGIAQQIIKYIGEERFPKLIKQIHDYNQTEDSSERNYCIHQLLYTLKTEYEKFAAEMNRDGQTIVFFFDTYEVIQFVDGRKGSSEGTEFSKWLENVFFPVLATNNTRVVIAGRNRLICTNNLTKVAECVLSLFDFSTAIAFLIKSLRIAEFSAIDYQNFSERFSKEADLLNPYRHTLGNERIGIWISELPDDYIVKFGEEAWLLLMNRVAIEDKDELDKDGLLDELGLTEDELHTIFDLANYRPIFLSLFVEWFRFNRGKIEPAELIEEISQYSEDKNIQRKMFDRVLVKRISYDYQERIIIYRMTVAYRRMNPEIMAYLTGYTLERCRDILLERMRHLSFIKYKKEGDVVLLHDEVRDLIEQYWDDPGKVHYKEISRKLVHYYEEVLLNDKEHSIKKTVIFPEDRNTYIAEFIEYSFISDYSTGLDHFCEEFDTAMEDARYSYADLLLREAEFCCKKYSLSDGREIIDLKRAEYLIDSNESNFDRALNLIEKVRKKKETDKLWNSSVVNGKFVMLEGIATFWLEKYNDAIKLFKKAKGIFILHEEQDVALSRVDNWIGYAYYRQANFNEAERLMKQSLTGLLDFSPMKQNISERMKRNILQLIQYIYGNMAMIYRYTGNFSEAIRNAYIQYNIVSSLPYNTKETLRSLNTLAHVLSVSGRTIDARFYLERALKIYNERPDSLLGGRLYNNFSLLSYDSIESAYMIEFYRAIELNNALEVAYGEQEGKRAETQAEKLDNAFKHVHKSIAILSKEKKFHKELADAYLSLGGLYMIQPESRDPEKWEKAEEQLLQAVKFGKTSQFKYSHIDSLVTLLTLYYFWGYSATNLSIVEKEKIEKKRERAQKELTKMGREIECYPDLLGRYRLTLGDITFDNSVKMMEEGNSSHTLIEKQLREASRHYFYSALSEKTFNRDRYHKVLRVIYNRLRTLIKEDKLISQNVIKWIENNSKKWENSLNELSDVFPYVITLLLNEKVEIEVLHDKIKQLEGAINRFEEQGEYRSFVLLNKCLLDVYRKEAENNRSEEYQEKLVINLNRQGRLYRLLGEVHYTRLCFERARKAIIGEDIEARVPITDPVVEQGLQGCTDIVEGEFCFRRGNYGSLLEFFLQGELASARDKFDEQFPGSRKKAYKCLHRGIEQLDQAVMVLKQQQVKTPANTLLNERIGTYSQQLYEAYFQLGELLMMDEKFILEDGRGAFYYLEKAIEGWSSFNNHSRLDDAWQSYLNAIYFSGNYYDQDYRCIVELYERKLNDRIEQKDYLYPRVAAKYLIACGDVLFSELFQIQKELNSLLSEEYQFVPRRKVTREDLLEIFRNYVEACDFKACFNKISFDTGLKVLRRRIELISDSASLDVLDGILKHLWREREHLRDKDDELKSILQVIRIGKMVSM